MQRAKEGFQKIAAGVLAQGPSGEAPVLAWPLVCGTAVASSTQALDFDPERGVLRVQVPDATWHAQLSDFAPRYVQALADLVGRRVESIEFVLPDERELKSA